MFMKFSWWMPPFFMLAGGFVGGIGVRVLPFGVTHSAFGFVGSAGAIFVLNVIAWAGLIYGR